MSTRSAKKRAIISCRLITAGLPSCLSCQHPQYSATGREDKRILPASLRRGIGGTGGDQPVAQFPGVDLAGGGGPIQVSVGEAGPKTGKADPGLRAARPHAEQAQRAFPALLQEAHHPCLVFIVSNEAGDLHHVRALGEAVPDDRLKLFRGRRLLEIMERTDEQDISRGRIDRRDCAPDRVA